jgi:hypothetical protein
MVEEAGMLSRFERNVAVESRKKMKEQRQKEAHRVLT